MAAPSSARRGTSGTALALPLLRALLLAGASKSVGGSARGSSSATRPLPGPREAWPDVLAVQGTWLFDQGSNSGYSVRQGGAPHGGSALVGPAHDWALGSHANPLFEFDIAVGAHPPPV